VSSPVSTRKLSKTFWIVVPALAIAVMSFFSPEPLFRFDSLRKGLSSMNEETFKVLFFGGLFFVIICVAAFFEKRRRQGLKLVAKELGFTFQAVSDSPKRLINDPWVLLSQLSKNRTGNAKNVLLDTGWPAIFKFTYHVILADPPAHVQTVFCFRNRTGTPKFRLLYSSDQRSLSYVENNLTAFGARAERADIYVHRPFDREFQIEGEDPEAVKTLFSNIERSEIKTLPQKMIVEATEAATFFYYPGKLVPVKELRKTYETCKDLHRSLMR
jgi:hypothetical protein